MAAIVKWAEKSTVWAERQKAVTVPRLWWHSHITDSSPSSVAHSMSWFRDSIAETVKEDRYMYTQSNVYKIAL